MSKRRGRYAGWRISLGGNTYNVTDLTIDGSNNLLVSSATYTFVAGDVGYYVWIPSGTNWTIGEYKISSVSGGKATLATSPSAAGNGNTASATIDRSQATSAQIVFDGVTDSATTSGTSATITVTGVGTTAADVGNWLNITGGTNFTTGVYQIVSVVVGAAGVGTWTLDRNCSSGAGAAMTGNMGGCFGSVSKVAAIMVSQNKAFLKNGCGGSAAGSTNISATITFGAANSVWTASSAEPSDRIYHDSWRRWPSCVYRVCYFGQRNCAIQQRLGGGKHQYQLQQSSHSKRLSIEWWQL